MKNNENKNRVNFEIDTTNYTFINLRELPINSIISINGMFIYKGKYGLTPVLINKKQELLISLPTHRAKKVSEILSNMEMVEQIKNNEYCIIVDSYEMNGNTYKTVRFKNKHWLRMEEIQSAKEIEKELENVIKVAKEIALNKRKEQPATTEQKTENTEEDLPF